MSGRRDSLEVRLRARLREFDLDVEMSGGPADRLALAGPSGAGKTTVLRMAAGLVKPDRGLVRIGDVTLFDDRDGTNLPPEGRRVGYVPQDPTLFPHLDAAANVAYAISGGRASARRRRATELLAEFGMAGMAGVHPGDLSGGEAQRVSLARAIAAEPSIFLLDEPLSSLDESTHGEVLPVLSDALDAAGAPVLLVTHSSKEARRLADRTIRIERGKVVGGRSGDSSRPGYETSESRPGRAGGPTASRRARFSFRRTMRR